MLNTIVQIFVPKDRIVTQDGTDAMRSMDRNGAKVAGISCNITAGGMMPPAQQIGESHGNYGSSRIRPSGVPSRMPVGHTDGEKNRRNRRRLSLG